MRALPKAEAERSLQAFLELERMETPLVLDALRRGDYVSVPTSATVACIMLERLGLEKAENVSYFTSTDLNASYREYWEISQLPAHDRPREMLERTGQSGAGRGAQPA